MKSIEFEIRSLDDAKTYAANELRVNESFIDIEVLDKKGMIIKTYVVRATTNVDPAEMGYKALQQMFSEMDIEANIEMRRKSDTEIVYSINSSENPLLIGKNGKTLENIQYYIRNLVSIFSDERMIVLVDIGGYKANRKKQLEILATKTAKNVARSRIEAKLEPMNAYERRIIHTKLSDWRDVTTVSEGEGSNRHLIIKPKRR
ncbi:RNA-binding cell elongation regulator Jag/EloR [Candidatus Xianfuyuplasma coldseepsis]|uniref:Single-stranded DNA-binding protein n=1 Tax=Candidatus Xianfuyuplasma coldseepsis TaxID=2782163 RepID=A0A7L7KQ66_9MOLU|nr:RNA-binding cell elongation regulator Jag/EloR [Xianfuyuplasma coldseepsis]QMS84941.1 single-stranded DNA-binding protein [Xianfuyuplasma coldseepsis]